VRKVHHVVPQQMLVTVSHPRQWALTPHNELNVPDCRRIGDVDSRGGEGIAVKGIGLLAVYSLGLGIPFVVAALAAEPFAAFLARFRAHLGLVEKAMGGLLVLTGVALLTGAISEVSYWLLHPVLGKIG
jgi:hypothetical protein